MKCAECKDKECRQGKDCTNIKEEAQSKYTGEVLKSMKTAASIESRYYMEKNRLEELIIYAKEMNYSHLGLAFCIGLEKEAEVLSGILSKHFTITSVCCKVCGIEKSEFDLERLHNDNRTESTCNPIGQAMVLNQAETQLNVVLGLCMGHDIQFTQNSKAPVTTLVVKDRVLVHNTIAAIYSNYYLKTKFDYP